MGLVVAGQDGCSGNVFFTSFIKGSFYDSFPNRFLLFPFSDTWQMSDSFHVTGFKCFVSFNVGLVYGRGCGESTVKCIGFNTSWQINTKIDVCVCVISGVPTGLVVLVVPTHDLLCRWKQTKEKLTEAELKGEKVSIPFELMDFCWLKFSGREVDRDAGKRGRSWIFSVIFSHFSFDCFSSWQWD